MTESTSSDAPVESNSTINITGGEIRAHDIIGGDQNIYGDQVQTKVVITVETAYDVHGCENPYLGLSAFKYEDRAKYAGREKLIQETVAKITAPASPLSLLFITGASGSGKSSFAQAGLLPALETFYGGFIVKRAVMRPAGDPFAALNDALWRQLQLPLIPGVSADATGLLPEGIFRETSPNQINLLVLDQFEEFFTQSLQTTRETFFVFLANLSPFSQTRTHIIATLRADYLPELFNHSALYDIAKRGVDLRAMNAEELKQAIQQPLRASPYEQTKRFEPALVERLAEDAAQDATYLPLLQVTIEEIWRKGILKSDAYKNLTDAIKQRADQVLEYRDFDDATPDEKRDSAEQAALMNLLLDLVDVSADDDIHRDVRKQRAKTDLTRGDPQRERWLNQLSAARLLSVQQEGKDTNQIEVDLIHETLLTNWTRLQTAIAERRSELRHRARFEQNLDEWLSQNRAEQYLLEGIRLAEARELDAHGDVALQNEDAKVYLRASIAKAEAEQQAELERERQRAEALRQRGRILRFAIAGVSVLALLAMLAGCLAFQQKNAADASSAAALTEAAKRGAAESTAVQDRNVAVRANSTSQAANATSEAEAIAKTTAEAKALNQATAANQAKGTAEAERNRAETEQQTARSRELAAVALNTQATDSELSLRLALEAFNISHTLEADDALRQIFFASFHKNDLVGVQGDPFKTQLIPSPDGNLLITIGEDKRFQVWDIISGNEIPAFRTMPLYAETAVFSPDSTLLVTADKENALTIWDPKTGEKTGTWTGAANPVVSLSFNSTGTRILAQSQANSVRIWETGRQSDPIAVFDELGSIQDAVLSPNGEWLLTTSIANYVQTIDVWDIATLKKLATWKNVMAWSFTQNGIRVFTYDHNASIYDQPSRGAISDFPADEKDVSVNFPVYSAPSDAVFNRDSTVLATMESCTSCEAELWNAANGAHIGTLSTHTNSSPGGSSRAGGTRKIVFSPTGSRIVTINGEDTAQLFDFSSGQPLLLGLFASDAKDASFSTDGNQILTTYSYNDSGRVDLWASTMGEHIQAFEDVSKTTFIPVNHRILTISGSDPKTVSLWETGAEARTFRGHTDSISTLEFEPSGKTFATGGEDGTARVWDITTGKQRWMLRSGTNVSQVGYTFNGSYVATASGSYNGTGDAILSDVNTGSIVFKSNPVSWGVCQIAFSPTKREIVYSTAIGYAVLIDIETGKQLREFEDRCGRVFFDADGQWIIIGNKIWDSNTGKQIGTLIGTAVAVNSDNNRIITRDENQVLRVETYPAESQPVVIPASGSIVSMSYDGQFVAVSDGKTANVWNSATGEKVSTMSGHTGYIIGIAFSLDNQFIVTGSSDQTARVWDIRTGQSVAILRGSDGQVTKVAFSPDQKYVLTGSKDGVARLYWTDIQDVINEAKTRGVRALTCEERIAYLHENITCPTPTPSPTP